jgi:hypothetical protein
MVEGPWEESGEGVVGSVIDELGNEEVETGVAREGRGRGDTNIVHISGSIKREDRVGDC